MKITSYFRKTHTRSFWKSFRMIPRRVYRASTASGEYGGMGYTAAQAARDLRRNYGDEKRFDGWIANRDKPTVKEWVNGTRP